MNVKSWNSLKRKRFSEDEIEELDQQVAEDLAQMTLQEIRRALGLTQDQLAELMELSQPELSRIERGKNPLLSTLRRYVEALGGELEVTAVFGDKRVKVEGM